jgi:hypothetical protein
MFVPHPLQYFNLADDAKNSVKEFTQVRRSCRTKIVELESRYGIDSDVPSEHLVTSSTSWRCNPVSRVRMDVNDRVCRETWRQVKVVRRRRARNQRQRYWSEYRDSSRDFLATCMRTRLYQTVVSTGLRTVSHKVQTGSSSLGLALATWLIFFVKRGESGGI